jgi:riboflavin synthase
MFTGIVEEIGRVERIKHGQHSAVLTIHADTVLEGTKIGDSIAVNGICLTVTELFSHGFSADVMHETLNRSSLAGLTMGTPVNLERAMAADGRFGGHIVAGHVDGVGKVIRVRRDDTAIWYTIQAKTELMRYIVEKGSITIDGISLTVAEVGVFHFCHSAYGQPNHFEEPQRRRFGKSGNGYHWEVCRKADLSEGRAAAEKYNYNGFFIEIRILRRRIHYAV